MAKNLPAEARDAGSISGSGRSPEGGNGNPLQYSCLENSIGFYWENLFLSSFFFMWTILKVFIQSFFYKWLASVLCFGFFSYEAYGILVSRTGIKITSPALEGEVLTTAREVPLC